MQLKETKSVKYELILTVEEVSLLKNVLEIAQKDTLLNINELTRFISDLYNTLPSSSDMHNLEGISRYIPEKSNPSKTIIRKEGDKPPKILPKPPPLKEKCY